MDNTLTAQDLKTKGTKILKEKTRKTNEAIITIRGKESYVVLTMGQYNYLRECELETALRESQTDLKRGNYKIKNLKTHIRELKNA